GRGRSPRWLVGDEERRDWLGEGGGAAERRSGCLQGWANGNCGYYPHFPWSDAPVARRRRRSRCTMCHLKLWTLSTISLVRLTGGSSTRVVGVHRGGSTLTRPLALAERLDVGEGMGDATGLGVTQRGGSWSRA